MIDPTKPLPWDRLIALQEANGTRLVVGDNIRAPADPERAAEALSAVCADIEPMLGGYHAVKSTHNIYWPHEKRDRGIAQSYRKTHNFAATGRALNLKRWTVELVIKRRFPELVETERGQA